MINKSFQRTSIAPWSLAPCLVVAVSLSPSFAVEAKEPGESHAAASQPSDTKLPDALVRAIRAGDASAVRRILATGVRIKGDDNAGLAIAAAAGRDEVALLLLELGASPNSADSYGRSALYCAALSDNPKIVKRLIESGARPDPLTGRNPLLAAIRSSNSEIAKMLIDAGANVAVTDEQGNTPLHLAAIRGSSDIVRALLDAGGDPNALNQYGRTPLFYARGQGRAAVFEMLRAAGGVATDGVGKPKRPATAPVARENRRG